MDIYTKLDQNITSDPNENRKILLQSLLSAKNKIYAQKNCGNLINVRTKEKIG